MTLAPQASPARVRQRLSKSGIVPHLLGLLLRRHFQRAGIVVVHGFCPFPHVENAGRIEVGNCSFFSGVHLECWKGATITIGTGTYLNRNAEIVAARSVSIGRDCKIARDVVIMDSDQHELSTGGVVAAPVVLGDRVWVGARAIILKGVTIGDDAVIGAGSVVTHDVPAGVIAAGVPAQFMHRRFSAS